MRVSGEVALDQGVEDQLPDQCGLLALSEEARAGQGDDRDLGAGLQGFAFLVGDAAVAAFAVHDPGRHAGRDQEWCDRAMASRYCRYR